MSFSTPLWFLAIIPCLLFLLLRRKGYVGFSDSKLMGKSSRLGYFFSRIPALAGALALTAIVFALARPQVPGEPNHRTVRGRDIILAVDISFSMTTPFKGELSKHEVPPELDFKVPLNDRRKSTKTFQLERPEDDKLKRIDASQNALMRFIENRWKQKTGDRIGIILFDDRPRYGWPITDDLRMLYRKAQFVTSGIGMGTNFGEHPPGPIDLAVEHFKEKGQAESRVLIIVTDGEDNISGYTKRRLLDLLKENRVKLYLVGIGETLANKDVDIMRLTESVGGKVFRVENANSLQECFDTIDQMEKSTLSVSDIETKDDVFYFFAWGALAFVAFLLASEVIIVTK
ncbi:MAG: VWA domain-containing protein [Cyanobacteria bacterium]|nr:VWA domain-containing protein [Cyanobacteriota bacterium]